MKVGLDNTLKPQHIKEIAGRYNFDVDNLTQIDSYETFIFRVTKGDAEWFMRIGHSKYYDRDKIKAELEWIEYLYENGISVAVPIPSNNGNLIEELAVDDFSFYTVVFNKLEGNTFAKDKTLLTNEMIEKWGKLAGKLHKLSKSYKVDPSGPRRPQWDQDPLIADMEKTLEFFPEVLAKALKVKREIKALPKSDEVYGLIHQDLHEDNIMAHNGEISIFDLEESHYSWYIEEIAIILFHYAWRFQSFEHSRDDLIKEFHPIFMKGYLSENQLSEEWLARIPLFVKFRHIRLFCTLAYESKIEFDEWSQKIMDHWTPMLENDEDWISPELISRIP